jgi:manganese transport protein
LSIKSIKFGPAALITAAFIGPGTVTTCIKAGFSSGYTLLWALVFATVATIALQSMVLHLTLSQNKSVEQELMGIYEKKWFKWLVGGLIMCSLLIGNSAYEAGNLAGATMGAEILFAKQGHGDKILLIGITLLAWVFIMQTKGSAVKNALGFLVIAMSISFLGAAIISGFPFLETVKGLFFPTVGKEEDWSTVMSLVGTTVVPYNIFLYSAMVITHYKEGGDIKTAQKDLIFNVSAGGLISVCILLVAAPFKGESLNNVFDFAVALEPVYGLASRWLIGFGLLAAGLTSAITAPLAAALITGSIVRGFVKMVTYVTGTVVLAIGLYFAWTAQKPVNMILTAQYINGLLLPFCTILLVAACFKKLPHIYQLKNLNGILAVFVMIITILLGLKSIS